jgi:hypothetical protein
MNYYMILNRSTNPKPKRSSILGIADKLKLGIMREKCNQMK